MIISLVTHTPFREARRQNWGRAGRFPVRGEPSMPDETEIEITRVPGAANATFPNVAITQSQLVFWLNKDSTKAPHWPLFPSTLQPRTQTGFGNTSDNVQ